jgi:hypothetical protein
MPSPKLYGETAPDDGKRAFEAHLGKPFELGPAGPDRLAWRRELALWRGARTCSYPVCDPEALIAAGLEAMKGWQAVGADGRTGICLEILDRLNKQSFEIAHAVMMTTGQGWMMAFQAGGPHAQDRGLEAVAYAWREQSFVPAEATWEKPQGKNPALVMKKHFQIVGRGVGLVVGCGTFPTWNTYPGLFAALATGNAVIVKPHSNAILPAAITVRTIRAVLAENGIDPNLVSLCVADQRRRHPGAGHPPGGQVGRLHRRQRVRPVADRQLPPGPGLCRAGRREQHRHRLDRCLQGDAGQPRLHAVAVFRPDVHHLAGDLRARRRHRHRGRPQELRRGLRRPRPRRRALPVQARGRPRRARRDPVRRHRRSASTNRQQRGAGQGRAGLAEAREPRVPGAKVRTPVLLACDAADEKAYMEERFGPISFIVKVADTAAAIALSERVVSTHGALTVGVYSTSRTSSTR